MRSKPTRIAIRFDATTGEKLRISKKSGAVIPLPELSVRYDRPPRQPTPGPKDTPAAAVAAVTYTPPPELVPYLSRAGALYRGPASEEERVPDLLRDSPLSRKMRNRVRRNWAAEQQKLRVSAEVVAQLAARAAAPTQAGGGGVSGGSGGGGGGASSPELR